MTKEEFIYGAGNWDNHRFLLWPALEETEGTIIEMGMGNGSTRFLRKYAINNNRHLFSYENNLEWFEKFPLEHSDFHEMIYLSDWDLVSNNIANPDVVFIDHAPGERRKIDIVRFADKAKVIVCHDTEPAADHGYQMRAELAKFKYQIDYQSPGAWASAVSNFIDVTKFQV